MKNPFIEKERLEGDALGRRKLRMSPIMQATAIVLLSGMLIFATPSVLMSTLPQVQADTTPLPASLAVSKVTAIGYEKNTSNTPEKTIDGNLSTRWSNLGKGSWIMYDLGQTTKYTISYVDISWYRGDKRVATFDISTSTDGTNFTTVFSGKSSGKTNSYVRYDFADVSNTRFVKITVYGNTENNWASINEVKIFGFVPLPPPTPTTTSTNSTTTTNTTTTTTPPPTTSSSNTDVFGITKLNPTIAGGNEWFSIAFAKGAKRSITWGTDTYDSKLDVKGESKLTINGDGTAQLTGQYARLYVSIPHENVEITMYGQLVTTLSSIQTYSGHDIEARTADGHHDGAPSSETCTGHAYGANIMYRQAIKFEKELNHPYYTSNNPEMKYSADFSQWMGVKYLIRNTVDGVKLEVYLDKTNGANGGTWVKTFEYTDKGGWSVSPTSAATACGIAPDYIIKGSKEPIVIFRDDGATKNLKWMSVREIAPIS
jgi:F5/8 type C domain-containing protein